MKEQDPIKLSREELEQIVDAIHGSNLNEEQKELIVSMLRTLDEVCVTLEQKRATIARLRKMLHIQTERIPRGSGESKDSSGSEKKTRIGLMGMTSLAINPLLLKFVRL